VSPNIGGICGSDGFLGFGLAIFRDAAFFRATISMGIVDVGFCKE
jgi:hypothetical protein